ncbi:hypothetical protein FA13DRAFT_1803253 [Coprinellus micaceus]|uniref:Uncharacterized protein n=1 Tax=Coprinellus micaceus TaxID=71717 RepID=A0A4Y7SAP7_COPMI|nr:hypothetical protein FA13DRAFT_1803253 [Coprinellus micaceus]
MPVPSQELDVELLPKTLVALFSILTFGIETNGGIMTKLSSRITPSPHPPPRKTQIFSTR